MSSAPSTADTFAPRSVVADATAAARRAFESALRTAQFAAFCAAILLPLTYLPLLADGLPLRQALLLVALLAIHAVTFVAGHGYAENR